MDRAGRAAWLSVVYYMRGTVAVAAIHAIVIGLALWIMGAPLVIPLAVLIFLAAFVPLVGLLVAGAVAIVVTLAAKGWVDAVILLCVLVWRTSWRGTCSSRRWSAGSSGCTRSRSSWSSPWAGSWPGIAGAIVAVPTAAAADHRARAAVSAPARPPGHCRMSGAVARRRCVQTGASIRAPAMPRVSHLVPRRS